MTITEMSAKIVLFQTCLVPKIRWINRARKIKKIGSNEKMNFKRQNVKLFKIEAKCCR